MTQIQTVPGKVQFKQFTDVFLKRAENNAGLKVLPLPTSLSLLSPAFLLVQGGMAVL